MRGDQYGLPNLLFAPSKQANTQNSKQTKSSGDSAVFQSTALSQSARIESAGIEAVSSGICSKEGLKLRSCFDGARAKPRAHILHYPVINNSQIHTLLGNAFFCVVMARQPSIVQMLWCCALMISNDEGLLLKITFKQSAYESTRALINFSCSWPMGSAKLNINISNFNLHGVTYATAISFKQRA